MYHIDRITAAQVVTLRPDAEIMCASGTKQAWEFVTINGIPTIWGKVSSLEEALNAMDPDAADVIRRQVPPSMQRPARAQNDLGDAIVAALEGKDEVTATPGTSPTGDDLGDQIVALIDAKKQDHADVRA